MPNKRIILLLISFVVGIGAVWGLAYVSWGPLAAYLAYIILTIYFLGLIVSHQQYEEDIFGKIERVAGSFLFSYIIFFRLIYAPLSQLFFVNLIKESSFFADLLALLLFMLFFFLFGTAFLVFSSYARMGFLPHWRFFNNEKMFFVLRAFFVAAAGIFLMLYIRNSFFSIKNSYYINKILPASSCGWTYVQYPNFMSLGQTAEGRDVCLYNYAQDRADIKFCRLIDSPDVKETCTNYFIPESEK